MFELLVPAEKAQLDRVKGDKKAYDLEIRPRLMVEAIHELQDAGVEPDIWKIEGLDRREDCEKMVAAARGGMAATRSAASFWAAARTTESPRVADHCWRASPGFIGFAVGRTDFWDPLVAWRDGKETRDEAVARNCPALP